MNPALRDSPVLRLRAQLSEKKAECAEAWKAFEDYRTENRGTLLKRKSGPVFDRATELHQTYEQLADEAKDLEKQLWESFDEKTVGGKSRTSGVEFGRVDGIARAFVESLGGAKGIDGVKALVSGASIVPAFWDERIRSLPQRQIRLRSLIPTVSAEGDLVSYVRQTAYTNLAAPVAAGALKPTSTITVEKVDTPVSVVAHLSEAIDRSILADYDSLENFLDVELRLGVLLAEENQILNGSGTPPAQRGILNTAGILTQAKGADPESDCVYKAMTLVRLQNYEPDGILLHPNDWSQIRLSKSTDGNYLTGAIAAGDDDVDTLFGKPVVTSPLITEGTGLVGAFGIGAKIYQRQEAEVRFAESGALGAAAAEIFSRNQVVFRAESRIAVAVERPQAFATCTGI